MANKLQQIRWQRNLSLKALSRMTGISESTLSRIENNKVDPRLSVVYNIAKGLKMNVWDIFYVD